MKTIYKYTLEITDRQFVTLPRNYRPLSVHMQGGGLRLWALVAPGRETVSAQVRIFGTCHPINSSSLDDMEFVGTVLDGSFVWHVFIATPEGGSD